VWDGRGVEGGRGEGRGEGGVTRSALGFLILIVVGKVSGGDKDNV